MRVSPMIPPTDILAPSETETVQPSRRNMYAVLLLALLINFACIFSSMWLGLTYFSDTVFVCCLLVCSKGVLVCWPIDDSALGRLGLIKLGSLFIALSTSACLSANSRTERSFSAIFRLIGLMRLSGDVFGVGASSLVVGEVLVASGDRGRSVCLEINVEFSAEGDLLSIAPTAPAMTILPTRIFGVSKVDLGALTLEAVSMVSLT